MNLLDHLSRRQLIVVTGKGGVGKTTLAAALGFLLARRGRQVLLLEADPRESLHRVLGTEPSDGALVDAGEGLRVQNLQPRTIIEELVAERVHIGFVARRITRSQAFRHFVAGAPGFKEAALLGYAFRVVKGDYKVRADLVILDAPATGHGLSLLAAPGLLAGAIRDGELGLMAAELASHLADPARTGVVLATLAEEMAIQETLELVALLKTRLQRTPDLILANGIYPALPGRAATSSPGPGDLWRQRREVNERELERLRKGWRGPLVELPLLPMETGPALLQTLAQRLGPALEGL
jgi:anion-transporting  ArsA/GET3 family ATPase